MPASLFARQQVLTYYALQFEKAFVINLPERTDKLDNFAVVSSLTGFTAEVIEGVKGAQVHTKALPALAGLPTVRQKYHVIVWPTLSAYAGQRSTR